MRMKLGIQVNPKVKMSVDKRRLRRLAEEALRIEGVIQPVELGLFLTDDQGIRELNCRYRGVDSPTDVLAFGGESQGFVSPAGQTHLGDIVISHTRALAQAEELGHAAEEEMDMLFVHGLLHLLGHEDETPEAQVRMWARQEGILDAVS